MVRATMATADAALMRRSTIRRSRSRQRRAIQVLAAHAAGQFQFHQTREELNVIQPLGGALAGELVVLPQERRQLERLEMIREQDLRGLGQAASPDSSDM